LIRGPPSLGNQVVDFRPERFEVGIFLGALPDFCFLAELGGLAEPIAGDVEPAELAGVAGEVVRHHLIFWEAGEHGEEGIVGFLGVTGEVESVAEVDPAEGIVRHGFGELPAEDDTGRPILALGKNVPAQHEDGGMTLEPRGKLGELGFGGVGVTEFQPALSGLDVPRIRM